MSLQRHPHSTVQTVFDLIKRATYAGDKEASVIRVVRDLATAAIERDDGYVNHYIAGGTLTLEQWKKLWQELTDLDMQAQNPNWRSTPEFEGQVTLLEHQLSGAR